MAAASVEVAPPGAGDVMAIARALRHLVAPSWTVRRVFGAEGLQAIEAAITESERQHGGELRFAVESNLDTWDLLKGVTPRDRALALFAQLGVWDTEANNGVLIYVLWADHDVEIVVDRGFNGRVRPEEWSAVCEEMEHLFKQGAARDAVIAGVRRVGELMARHFPKVDRNEQSDRPVVL